jgi:hypothetical protein
MPRHRSVGGTTRGVREAGAVTESGGVPSDELRDVLSVGMLQVRTFFVSMAARHPEGRDAEYLRWHTLDHRPEQHRLATLRGSLRLVSTPACRAARAAADEQHDSVDHVMTYLFADGSELDSFLALGAALAEGGRMPVRLPNVSLGTFDVRGVAADPRVLVGSHVIPWRPATGVYLVVERLRAGRDPVPAASLVRVEGVAGVWWLSAPDVQLTYCFLDGDPVVTAEQMRGPLAERWAGDGPIPMLAAPFHVVEPPHWDRHLP